MIKALTVTNPKGETLRLELTNPDPSGLYIKDIEGLGPPKANINTSELATIDGSLYASSRCENRNIVITLGMLFAPTIEDSRQKTYKFFPIKKESTQISIICPDPYFYEVGGSEKVYTNVEPLFEFPFSNESLTENLLEMGKMVDDPRAVLSYVGDMDTGVVITIHALTKSGDITLYNVDTREHFKIFDAQIKALTGAVFDAGDDIIISTVKGNKYARLLREGKETNIISAVDMDADWFQVSNGVNMFNFVTQEEEANLLITFSYKNAYGGI